LVINNEVWKEFNNVAQELIWYKEEADLYDLFDVMRQVHGGSAYSPSYLKEIDSEIDREVKAEWQHTLKR